MSNTARIDVYSPDGTKLGPGPITSLLTGSYQWGIGKVGEFTFDIPAEEARSTLVGHGYELRVYRSDEGLVFRGIVDKLSTIVTVDGRKVLRITGASLARKLVWGNTLVGLQFAGSTPAEAVDTLLTYATGGFTAGSIDGASTVLEAARMDGLSVWAALSRVADSFNMLLREDNINVKVDMGTFGANPKGLRFINANQLTPELSARSNTFVITDIEEVATSEDVWTRVVPLGASQGVVGANPAMDLSDSTRTTPFPIVSYLGPDGTTQYAMEDYTGQALYGVRTKVLFIKDAAPLGLTTAEFIAAANTMYDRAATWLSRHNSVQTTYAVRVIGVRHLVNGQTTFNVGDKVRITYRGIVVDQNGTRLWKDIDTELYIMEARRSWEGSTDVWDFVVSDVTREVDDDGNRSAALLEEVTTLQAVPTPFVYFAGEGAAPGARLDKYGWQFKNPDAIEKSALWIVNDFDPNPNNLTTFGSLQGNVPDSLRSAITQLAQVASTSNRALVQTTVNRSASPGSRTSAVVLQAQHDGTITSLTINQPDSGVAGEIVLGGGAVRYPTVTSDPVTPQDGDRWYRSDVDKFYRRENGVTFEDGGGMNKVTGSGYLVMSAAAVGIDPANAGVAWTSGAWSQVVASTSEADSIIGIIYGWDSLTNTTRVEAEIDIGTGGAGSETAVSTIPALKQQSVTGGGASSSVSGASDEHMVMFPAPIEVASGTRVAVRVRSSDTGLEPNRIRLVYTKKTELVAR